MERKKNNTKYTAGDWVFCDFTLQQVRETENGWPVRLSNGVFSTSGGNIGDRCYPLDLRIKLIAEKLHHSYTLIHKEGGPALNYPDISRWFENKWVEICDQKDNEEAVAKGFEEVDQFVEQILKRVNLLSLERVGGVKVFR